MASAQEIVGKVVGTAAFGASPQEPDEADAGAVGLVTEAAPNLLLRLPRRGQWRHRLRRLVQPQSLQRPATTRTLAIARRFAPRPRTPPCRKKTSWQRLAGLQKKLCLEDVLAGLKLGREEFNAKQHLTKGRLDDSDTKLPREHFELKGASIVF